MAISLLPRNDLSHEEIEYVRGQYNIVLGRLRQENPQYEQYIGCFSPYSGRKIRDAEDFDEYLRQLTISEIYKKLYLADCRLYKKKIELQKETIADLNKRLEWAKEKEEDAKRKKKKAVIIAFLFAIMLIASWRWFLL